MENRNVLIFIGVIILIVAGIVFFTGSSAAPDPGLTTLAMCIKDSGAKFYGAFWCPHCQATKKLFGAAQKELPYIECSTADTKGQTQICIDKKIQSYPTWDFPDGTRETGELSLAYLAQKTNCPLPSGVSSDGGTLIISTSSPAMATSTSPVATSTKATTTSKGR